MMVQTPRDPWRTIWQAATGDYLMAALLLGIAAGLAITAWLPQTPVDNPVAYAQWLSETQARFGDATPTMQTLGLFAVTRSFAFRALLALLAGILLLRLIEDVDRLQQYRTMAAPGEGEEWHTLTGVRLPDVVDNLRRWRYRILSEPPLLQADRWPWADLFPLLAHGGGLLFLLGLLVTHIWGWRMEGMIVQSGGRATLPHADAWVAWDEHTQDVTHSPGIMAFVEEQVAGTQARAEDGTGRTLSLQQTPEVAPVPLLTLPLAEDQYFAIPDAQLVVRLAPRPDGPPDQATEAPGPVLVQVYRSPPGRLTTETMVEGEAKLTVDDTTLELTTVPYARLAAVFNPGLWPTGVGLLFLLVGLLGYTAWPTRRLWLREETEYLEASGDPLPILVKGKEA